MFKHSNSVKIISGQNKDYLAEHFLQLYKKKITFWFIPVNKTLLQTHQSNKVTNFNESFLQMIIFSVETE